MRVSVGALGIVLIAVACSSSSPKGGSDGGSGSSSGGGAGTDSGGACPTGQTACNGGCCDPGAVCADDGVTRQCAQPCTANGGCPSTGNSCCTLLPSGTGACLAPGSFTGQECLCATQTDCRVAAAAGCCAPKTDANMNPTSTYVCKTTSATTGATAGAYECCNSLAGGGQYGCASGFCCLYAGSTNETSQVCFETCQTSANCGGSATCVAVGNGKCNGAANVCQ
ncbi:MAG: hypothetical protein ACRELB_17890 [Polyangiaceae bacterium]